MSPKLNFFDGELPSLTGKDSKRAEEFDRRESGLDYRGVSRDRPSMKEPFKTNMMKERDFSFKKQP